MLLYKKRDIKILGALSKRNTRKTFASVFMSLFLPQQVRVLVTDSDNLRSEPM